MSLNKIPFSVMSVEAVFELTKQSEAVISARHAGDALLGSSLAGLEEPKRQAILNIGSSRKQELTHKIDEADYKRDRAFIGLRKHLDADLFNDWDTDRQRAADNLMAIVKRHGTTLYNEGLTVQSALLTSLFEDLEAETAKTDLATLGLTEWVTHLKDCQREFTGFFMQRNELESAKDIPTQSEAKKGLVDAIAQLLNGLDFLASSQPDNYGETHKLVEEIVNRIVASERVRNVEGR